MKTNNFQLKDSFSEFKNYYAVLGIPNYAPIEQVKRVFKQLALYTFPEDSFDSSIKLFVKFNEAYNVIGDPKRKDCYDSFLMVKDKNAPLLIAYSDVDKDGLWHPGLEHEVKAGTKIIRHKPTLRETLEEHSF